MSQRTARYLVVTSCAWSPSAQAGCFVTSIVRVVRDLPVHHAAAQADIFEDMRKRSLETTDAGQIAGYLAYVVSYYPSGSKHATGSSIDRIVEGYRAATVREIIERLKAVTKRPGR